VSDLKIRSFNADKSPVNGVYLKNNKKFYLFTAKKTNYLIKSISVKYSYYDKVSNSYKNITKVYNGKNKKSLNITIPKYQKTERVSQFSPSGNNNGYGSVGSVYFVNKEYSYNYEVLKFSIKYSNNKKDDSKKSTGVSNFEQRSFSSKKTTVTRSYQVDLVTSKIIGKIKYNIQTNKKSDKIKKIDLNFEYKDSANNPQYKTVSVNGKNKNTISTKVPNNYRFISAKVVY
jgi:hypothetical protein